MTGVPSAQELRAAAQRIKGHIRSTPTICLQPGELGVDLRVTLKLEYLQHTGSFKARGALNSVLSAPAGTAAVVAASGGNHGAAVAWAASTVGIPATIFVPSLSPPAKQELIRRYGADLRLVEGFYADALQASLHFADQQGAHRIDAYDSPSTVAGQASLGAELAEQIPAGEPVIVSCGGGGLFAGVTLALTGRNPVLAGEPETAPTLSRALAAGRPVDVDVSGVAVDSLGARRAGTIAVRVAQAHHAQVLLVPDTAITTTAQLLWDRLRIRAEAGAVTGLAAALHHQLTTDTGSITAVISGANCQ